MAPMLCSGESDTQSRDEMPGTGDGRARLLGIGASASSSTTSPHKGADPCKALMHHICDMIPRLKTRTQRQGGADQQAQGSANASKKGGKGGKGAKGKR
ncbi:hypothetical protein HPB50_026124 [Hyalomma asiaticum]|uniref:Uncharacterized protein n=1 Tax=Hyalomma asiaticum TaxID=266040 RepID=A0ACB7SA81_HYAAI|nr:hypothetical protein HPB50_026124 [Hyalomma asiaticum]